MVRVVVQLAGTHGRPVTLPREHVRARELRHGGLERGLRGAQAALKTAVPQLARVYVLNWKRYWATVRTCKLYDYANHQWLDFKGRVTAAPLFPEAAPAAG